jgi:hypothetical protein
VASIFSSRAVRWATVLSSLLVLSGCGARKPPPGPPAGADAAPRRPPAPDLDGLPAAAALPPERRALQVVHGEERIVDAALAAARGLTLVDLADDWAPPIFQDGSGPDGSPLPNRYRAVFVGLANDRTDGDGQALRPGEVNHLELYGIPPSLSVLRARFLADGQRTCMAAVDTGKLLAVDSVATWGAATEKKELARARARGERLEQARADAGADAGPAVLDERAAADPRLARELAAHRRFVAERAAFAEAEKRLACEGLMDPARHVAGAYDTPMRFAMLAFQRKNALLAEADITRATLEALARTPLANDHLALRRVLTERAAHAGGLLEDGSAGAGSPDLVGQATAALLARLGAETPEAALAFFRRRAPGDFRWLRAAVRFPPTPAYHAAHMELEAEIDRGDVWYDFPFDQAGRRLPQPRRRYPSFTLYARREGARVPLVRWRTTIGSWRSELAADGHEYLRYKDSDVGARVWRHVVAAPVWVPPASSPLGGMVKEKWVNGAIVKVTNYDEVGPGFLSAYGLVAALHVEPRPRAGGASYFDNGIRTHGTFDYTSLRGRFSHGCHRLANNLAVRLFSFVIRHRKARVLGQTALDFRRSFWRQNEVFDLRLPTRGYYYELDPPLPVETLLGDIKGNEKKPPMGYVRKPGEVYPSSVIPSAPGGPDDKAGGGGAGEAEP